MRTVFDSHDHYRCDYYVNARSNSLSANRSQCVSALYSAYPLPNLPGEHIDGELVRRMDKFKT